MKDSEALTCKIFKFLSIGIKNRDKCSLLHIFDNKALPFILIVYLIGDKFAIRCDIGRGL